MGVDDSSAADSAPAAVDPTVAVSVSAVADFSPVASAFCRLDLWFLVHGSQQIGEVASVLEGAVSCNQMRSAMQSDSTLVVRLGCGGGDAEVEKGGDGAKREQSIRQSTLDKG